MSTSFVQFFYKSNVDFLKEIIKASQVDRGHLYTAVPSIIFLVFSFILLHRILHRRTNSFTPFRLFIYREIGFQWTYFYLARFWLLCIKILRCLLQVVVQQLKAYHLEKRYLNVEEIQFQRAIFCFSIFLSMVPACILFFGSFWRQNIPNFLLWVGEDPWVRSEIGISGHYLDRPVTFFSPKRKDFAYRRRRSMSLENTTSKLKQPPRISKSLEVFSR